MLPMGYALAGRRFLGKRRALSIVVSAGVAIGLAVLLRPHFHKIIWDLRIKHAISECHAYRLDELSPAIEMSSRSTEWEIIGQKHLEPWDRLQHLLVAEEARFSSSDSYYPLFLGELQNRSGTNFLTLVSISRSPLSEEGEPPLEFNASMLMPDLTEPSGYRIVTTFLCRLERPSGFLEVTKGKFLKSDTGLNIKFIRDSVPGQISVGFSAEDGQLRASSDEPVVHFDEDDH